MVIPMSQQHQVWHLASIFRRVARYLVDNDWVGFETDNGKEYFILGENAWSEEECERLGIEFRRQPKSFRPTTLGEHTIRAEVAHDQPPEDYLEVARRELESEGVKKKDIDAFVDKGEVGFTLGDPFGARFEAFQRLLDSMILGRVSRGDLLPDAEDRQAVESDRERLYLLELARIYPKLLDRSARLTALDFRDDQLNEASRCYLYGFWRATVVLSATALDKTLSSAIDEGAFAERVARHKKQTGRTVHFALLVKQAEEEGLLGKPTTMGEEPPYAQKALAVFDLRNRVVHDGLVPDVLQAEKGLLKARTVIEYLRASHH